MIVLRIIMIALLSLKICYIVRLCRIKTQTRITDVLKNRKDVRISKIITDIEILRQNSEPISVEDAKPIVEELIQECNSATGLGLTAIQIGIPKRVAIVLKAMKKFNSEYYVLVNPKIVHASASKIINFERCLSMPGTEILTTRAENIVVRSDSFDTPEKSITFQGLLAVIAQHEIDHMNGILITDREYKVNKIERNAKIKISDGKDIQIIKFKNLYKYPNWYMIEETPELV